eukprot:CAMPEP_0114231664 /NCGR_PEP_ID=MMETSP0058-20121206/4177_1 /TAXON_ID=36894 /ORGANISM="Pyramimonas parkeae, CCMP726" /LENGTH=154 /DNA_ID=CAMNT_0001343053 /DNA_START=194 /DNA_END=658 /DNA_ORIENTATION=-
MFKRNQFEYELVEGHGLENDEFTALCVQTQEVDILGCSLLQEYAGERSSCHFDLGAFLFVAVVVFLDATKMIVLTVQVVLNIHYLFRFLADACFHTVTTTIPLECLELTARLDGNALPSEIPLQPQSVADQNAISCPHINKVASSLAPQHLQHP